MVVIVRSAGEYLYLPGVIREVGFYSLHRKVFLGWVGCLRVERLGFSFWRWDVAKGAEKEITDLREINRMLKMFIACNQALLEIKSEEELKGNISKVVVEKGNYAMCWVGVLEEGDFVPVAYVRGRGYVEGRKTNWQVIASSGGPTAEALRGNASLEKNMLDVPFGEPWREEVLAGSFRFFVSLPLVYQGERLGVFNVYARKAGCLTGERYRLLGDLASDIALALSLLRVRLLQEELREALEVSEERYRLIFEHAPMGLLEFGLAAKETCQESANEEEIGWMGKFPFRLTLLRANRQALSTMGAENLQVVRETFLSLFPEDSLVSLEAFLVSVFGGSRESQKELAICTPDGKSGYWQFDGICIPAEKESEKRAVIAFADIIERRMAQEEEKRWYADLEKLFGQVVRMASALIEVRCPYTAGHQRRVARLAYAIGKELGMDEEALQVLSIAGMLHDIGKMGIPAEILNKPAQLTGAEWELVKTHVQLGYEVVKDVDFPPRVKQAILEHHERLDGSGYPRGLKNGQITLEGKILAVADVVEAMSSHRPYRPSLGIARALEEIQRQRDCLYDARLVDLCVRLFQERGFSFEDEPISFRNSANFL